MAVTNFNNKFGVGTDSIMSDVSKAKVNGTKNAEDVTVTIRLVTVPARSAAQKFRHVYFEKSHTKPRPNSQRF